MAAKCVDGVSQTSTADAASWTFWEEVTSLTRVTSDVTSVTGATSDVTSLTGATSDVTSVTGVTSDVTSVTGVMRTHHHTCDE